MSNIFPGVYAILDLYGQCAEVTITNSINTNTSLNLNIRSGSTALPLDIDQFSASPSTPGKDFVELETHFLTFQMFATSFNVELRNFGVYFFPVFQVCEELQVHCLFVILAAEIQGNSGKSDS